MICGGSVAAATIAYGSGGSMREAVCAAQGGVQQAGAQAAAEPAGSAT